MVVGITEVQEEGRFKKTKQKVVLSSNLKRGNRKKRIIVSEKGKQIGFSEVTFPRTVPDDPWRSFEKTRIPSLRPSWRQKGSYNGHSLTTSVKRGTDSYIQVTFPFNIFSLEFPLPSPVSNSVGRGTRRRNELSKK